jgi:hypothetical protein
MREGESPLKFCVLGMGYNFAVKVRYRLYESIKSNQIKSNLSGGRTSTQTSMKKRAKSVKPVTRRLSALRRPVV